MEFHIWQVDIKKMCTLIRHTNRESLMKIHWFRHEWSSINYENTQKNTFHNLQLHQHINTSKSVYLLDTYSVKVWWSYVLPNTNAVYFCDIFFRHRAKFSTCPNKESRKSKIQQLWNNLRQYTVLLVYISGLYINWCRLQTTDDNDNNKINKNTNRQTFLRIV